LPDRVFRGATDEPCRPPLRTRTFTEWERLSVENEKRCVLLDIDGTLVDSNDAHAQAWVDTFAEFGMEVGFRRVRPLIGMGGDRLLSEAAGVERSSELGERLSAYRTDLFLKKYLPTLHPFPGIRPLLRQMKAEGLELVVATSANRAEAEGLLDLAGIDDLVGPVTGADDAERSKPAPDILDAALEAGTCAPGSAIFLGDTPYDVEAAVRLGVPVVALRCGGWSDRELEGAIAIFDDPADLLAHFHESPFVGLLAGP
jgi:HAD superfamily hydrolase (TIGR01509 family)